MISKQINVINIIKSNISKILPLTKEDKKEIIKKLISKKNPVELMKFINQNYDNKETSFIFDKCYSEGPDICRTLQRRNLNEQSSCTT